MIDLSTLDYLTKGILCLAIAIGFFWWNRGYVKRKRAQDGYLGSYEMAQNFRDWLLIITFLVLSLLFLSKY